MKKENIGNRIVQGLDRASMTQKDLSEITNIPGSSISQYCNNRKTPRDKRISLIAKALNVNEAWLLGFDVPPEREEGKKNNSPELYETVLDEFKKHNATQKDIDAFMTFLKYHFESKD